MTKLTLLQLSLGVGGKPLSFAPHVWKTLLPLRLFGVEFATEFVVSAQLEEELPKRFNLPKVTIPTLIVDEEDGSQQVIVDSVNIAMYIEQRFSTPTLSLYSPAGNASKEDVEAGKSMARFLEHWVDKSLAAELRPCTIAAAYDLFPSEGSAHDPPSKARFLSKVGQARMDELRDLNNTTSWSSTQHAKARIHLSILDTMLRERYERGEAGPFVLGSKPTHCDFVIFAFYPYSLVNPDLIGNTWRAGKELPYVGKWLDAIFATGLVSETELLPHVP